ncbi:hypothetical protein Zm00014a_044146 [Zea mays]|uniref:Uncharacterized protein n=1 Tax=Zea mays TaxID=4577 RepID=A0A3L6E9I1_MAIZE|nr:hypothetical protein Zm00014a_044146 [Zea mays]
MKVVSREVSVISMKVVVDARHKSDSDLVIVARTDSRQAGSLTEALCSVRTFADVGADVIFIDTLASREDMKALFSMGMAAQVQSMVSPMAF